MRVLLAQAQVSQRLQLDCAPSSSRWEVGACAGETCMGQTPLLMRVWRARVHLLGLPLSATRAFLAEFRRIVAVSPKRRKSKPPDPKTFRKMNPPPQNVPKIRMDGCTQGNCCTTSQRCRLLYQVVTLDDPSFFHSKMRSQYYLLFEWVRIASTEVSLCQNT